MNIGIVTTWFERGAAYVSKQYKELLEDSNSVYIYARGEEYAKGNPIWDTSNVTWGKRGKNYSKYTIDIQKKDFLDWIKLKKIDVVFFNEQHCWLPVIWCKEMGIKVGSYIDYYTEETVPFFNIYDFLICNTKRHYSVFKSHKNCTYIPWGTDVELFKPSTKRDCDKDKIVFFNSCGHNPYRKGVGFLIKIFKKLENQDIKLLVHTQKRLENYYPELVDDILELEKNGKLEVITETITAPGLYHYGDIYCYLSILDGIGLTLPEAISCGLPALIPDNAPMNEFVDDNIGIKVKIEKLYSRKDGYYWPQCSIDEKDLMQKVKNIINKKNEIEKMKKEARNYALKNLNWSNQKEFLNEVFKNITKTELNKELERKILEFEYKKLLKNPFNLFGYPKETIKAFKFYLEKKV